MVAARPIGSAKVHPAPRRAADAGAETVHGRRAVAVGALSGPRVLHAKGARRSGATAPYVANHLHGEGSIAPSLVAGRRRRQIVHPAMAHEGRAPRVA